MRFRRLTVVLPSRRRLAIVSPPSPPLVSPTRRAGVASRLGPQGRSGETLPRGQGAALAAVPGDRRGVTEGVQGLERR